MAPFRNGTDDVQLDAQMRADELVRQIGNRARRDSAAVVENAELARHATREWELLLDQEYGNACFLVEFQNDIADFVDDVGLNSFGRLVENKQLRFEHKRAAD